MMKRYLAFLLVGLAGLPAFGQQMSDYYQLPSQQQQYKNLLTRYGGAYIQDRWYVSLSGFARTDRAQLDNSLNGLIESNRVTKLGWSALVGWSYKERWAVEAGYANSAIHSELLIKSSPSFVFPYTNNKQGFVLRGKRMIFSTSGPWRRSGFWLTGGLWLVPNSGQNKGSFTLAGYGYKDRQWEKPDTLRLKANTTTNTQLTTLVEAGAEYNVRLSDQFDLGFSVRKLWGLGSSLTTDMTYIVNGREAQQTQLKGMGSGMTYGMTLRYTFAMHRKLANVLEVKGKQRIK